MSLDAGSLDRLGTTHRACMRHSSASVTGEWIAGTLAADLGIGVHGAAET